MEKEIEKILVESVASLGRPDLFRRPIVGFSSAQDPRYQELKRLIGDWHLSPDQLLPGAQSVISCFVPFTREVVDQPKAVPGGSVLWGEAYQVINGHFGQVGQAITRYLTERGHSATAIPATHTYDPKDMKSMWSHKSAAAIAGLGVFGANRILITRKGSGGRFCTVITSARLAGEQEPITERCRYLEDRSCYLCFQACPAKAIAPGFLDRFACQAELFQNGEELERTAGLTQADTCGKCVSVCPAAYLE